jgi:hypothetical protein
VGRTYDDVTAEVFSSLPGERQRDVATAFSDFSATLKGFLEAKAAAHGEGYEVSAEDIHDAMAMVRSKQRRLG